MFSHFREQAAVEFFFGFYSCPFDPQKHCPSLTIIHEHNSLEDTPDLLDEEILAGSSFQSDADTIQVIRPRGKEYIGVSLKLNDFQRNKFLIQDF